MGEDKAKQVQVESFTKSASLGLDMVSLNYKVHGFWSSQYIRVTRHKNRNAEGWGLPEVLWVSGGRDLNAEPNEAVAVQCFCDALADAIKEVEKLSTA